MTETVEVTAMDVVAEFNIQTAGYGAEYGRSSGGVVSVATKSGTNEFHGTAYEYLRNTARDANDWLLIPTERMKNGDFGESGAAGCGCSMFRTTGR